MGERTHVRESRPEDDSLIASHFHRMWRDNGIVEDHICPDWKERVLAFIGTARRERRYRAFIAELAGGGVIGSAGCQLFAGLYPDILAPAHRQYGYIWGVYVEPEQRRQGVARLLTETAMAYLMSIGCTHALLHASPLGRPVYTALGFEPTNEMRFLLKK